MKNQKNIKINGLLTLMVFTLFGLNSFSQDHPPFPSVDAVFNKVKAMESVYNQLNKIYKVEKPKQSKLEKLQYEGGDYVNSYFYTYKSSEADRLNWRWPDDRAKTVFKVTTPPNKEGVTYELPLIVEYTRLDYGTLTTKWKYHRWYFGNPYSVKGGKEDELLLELVNQKLNSYEGNIFKNKRNIPDAIAGFIKITDVRKSKDQAVRNVYSNMDEITQSFVISGDRLTYKGYDEAEIDHHYVGASTIISVVFERDKDEKGTTGEWRIRLLRGYRGSDSEMGTDNGDKKFYKTTGNSGFKTILESKDIVEIPIPYFAEKNKPLLLVSVRTAVNDFFESNGDVSKLEAILAPGDTAVLNTFVRINDEFNDKFITLLKHSADDKFEAYVPVFAGVNENVEKCYAQLLFRLDRQGYDKNKPLKKIYKEGGMSKTEMAQYGRYSKNFRLELGFILVNGELKVNSINMRSYPTIPF